jgi:hypothetical protein
VKSLPRFDQSNEADSKHGFGPLRDRKLVNVEERRNDTDLRFRDALGHERVASACRHDPNGVSGFVFATHSLARPLIDGWLETELGAFPILGISEVVDVKGNRIDDGSCSELPCSLNAL